MFVSSVKIYTYCHISSSQSDPDPATTQALERFTLGPPASEPGPSQFISAYEPHVPGSRPVSGPNPYRQSNLGGYQSGFGQPIERGSYQPLDPGPGQYQNPYPTTSPLLYQSSRSGLSQPTEPGLTRGPGAGSGQSGRRGPAYANEILNRSDEEEEESQKAKDKTKKKEQGKRQRPETPGVEAGAHRRRRRPFDPARDIEDH